MPMYKYKCPFCKKEIDEFHKIKDRYSQVCSDCGGEMDIVINPTPFHIFEGFWHPNLDKKPVFIKSKQHLREESEKRNMTSFY